ncbi:hypothetical protein RHSIM_Rhsim03G0138300 [Rhododendron simsii]|uniref:Uncharacterized protein n=1 Tax=Rhododendron simsii TaxID=118357 RepID=A0A834LT28_RHOSS|nr:hypothetical protein RHSIM_Rhsim03G0138300 [Rhododendron simsii]
MGLWSCLHLDGLDLRTLGVRDCSIQEMGDLCSTTSIWSVDLAFLLQKFSVRFSYFPITLGANLKFSVETLYKVLLEKFLNDLVRVEMLFQKAIEAIRIRVSVTSEVDCSQMLHNLHYNKFLFYAVNLGLGMVAIQATLVAAQDTPVGRDLRQMSLRFKIQRALGYFPKHQKITSKRLEEAHKSFGTNL